MKKIWLILQREYLTRVKKKSFLVMTILGPLLMAGIVIVPYYLATSSRESKKIAVIDETGLFRGKFGDIESVTFYYPETDIWTAKESFGVSHDDGILYIPATDLALPTNAILYSSTEIGMPVRSYIRTIMTKRIEDLKLEAQLRDLNQGRELGVNLEDLLRSVKTSIDINTIKIDPEGNEKKSYAEVNMILAMVGAILIYFFIFMFGAQVMRGVIEEKSNRIIEVIVSSVKPFQLMMGKIIGVGMVGLTQFLLWVLLTFLIISIAISSFDQSKPAETGAQLQEQPVQSFNPNEVIQLAGSASETEDDPAGYVLESIRSIDFPVMISSFVFYFLFGYLLYAALFAAIGGAVDSEADTQQFMLPVTAPLILAIIMAQSIVNDPDSSLAVWLSMIPFTSPVIMMIRIPFGVPYIEVFSSMVLLVAGFLATTWMAGRIYRTGILIYGKKVTYKELWKWLRH